jgi:hypothetical protein
VLAVAIGYVSDSGVEILTPAVYGMELAESKSGLGRRRTWGRTSFLDELRVRSPEAARGIEAVMMWAADGGAEEVYGSGKDGSWYPVWHGQRMKDSPMSAWTSGSICFNFSYLRERPGFDEDQFRADLRRQIEAAGIKFLPAKDSPGIAGVSIEDDGTRDRFLAICAWVRDRFYATSASDTQPPKPNRPLPDQS